MTIKYDDSINSINSLIWQIRDKKMAYDAGEVCGLQLSSEQQQTLLQQIGSLHTQVQQEVAALGALL